MRINRGRSRKGSVAVLTAVMLTMIMAMLSLAVDAGMMYQNRRMVQSTADAAALAAAANLYANFNSWNNASSTTQQSFNTTAASAGTTNATTNFNASYTGTFTASPTTTSSGSTVTQVTTDSTHKVTINVPPVASTLATALGGSTNFNGKSGYAEAIVAIQQPAYFSGVLGNSAGWIYARAVARGRWDPSNNGIISLAPSMKEALVADGGGNGTNPGSIAVNGASIIVDSNNTQAAAATNGAHAYIEIEDNKSIVIVGSWVSNDNFADLSGNPLTPVHGAPAPDPLAYLPQPSQPSTAGTITALMPTPGGLTYYLMTAGDFSNVSIPNKADSSGTVILMQPGLYYFGSQSLSFQHASLVTLDNVQNALTANSVSSLVTPSTVLSTLNLSLATSNPGPGVTIFAQSFDLEGNSSAMALTAPTSGTYQGITLWQDRNSSSTSKITGNGQNNITGTVYSASGEVDVGGNGDGSMAGQLIAYNIKVNGNGVSRIIYNPTTVAPTKMFGLCE